MSKSYGNLQKYQNPNPLQRWFIARFLSTVARLLEGLQLKRVLDVGCAEGFVSSYIAERYGGDTAFVGVDLDAAAMLRGRDLFGVVHNARGDARALPFPDASFDLVVCTEVLEHLSVPETTLRELRRVARSYVLLSVPHEPWFRLLNAMRGKHMRQWGNDPEHMQQWTATGFADFAAQELTIVKRVSSIPWSLVLCRRAH